MRARLAQTADDFQAVYALAERGYAESRYGRYPLRVEKFERLGQLCQHEPDVVLCVIVEEGAEIVGFLCGIVADHYFADARYATNLSLYVAPEHRGSAAAALLIVRFEREAAERGANEVMLAASSGIEPERTVNLYNAMGYQTVGGLTVKYLGDDNGRGN